MIEKILITGATGFVGINLVKKLIRNENIILYLLVRDLKGTPAKKRINSILREHFSEEEFLLLSNRINIICGDVTEENLGLSDLEWNNLAREINIIFHSAASINFKLSIESATEINVIGTKRVMDLASKCKQNNVLKRVNHISTAYVVGNSKKIFYENELEIGQGFDNTYEITKYETEKLVHSYISEGLPITIFRPSVIAGDFYTGEITKSNLIFGFIKQISCLRYKDFICNDDSSLNIIPVDYFIDTILEISSKNNSIGNTYHIINNNNSNIKNMVKTCCNFLNIPIPNFIPIKNQEKVSGRTLQLLEVFITYIEKSHTFDDRLTKQLLQGTEISCPTITNEFLERTILYCQNKNYLKI